MERSTSWNKHVFVNLAVALSIAAISGYYFQNRSLFLDSLNLARNIAESTYSEFLNPLKYEQSTPLLFLILSKIITQLFGISEYSLRIIPLISGIGSVILFSRILIKLCEKKVAFAGTLLFGCHLFILRYATEFKQYMTDTFVCIFLIWLCLYIGRPNRNKFIAIGCLGTISIWLSMPSVFVIFSLILFLIHHQIKSKSSITPVILLSIWFFLNFVMEYFLILQPAIHSSHMQNFHNQYFLQGEFWRLESLSHDFGLIIAMVRLAVGKSALAITVSFILIGATILHLWKSRKSVGLIIFSPIIAVLIASLFGKYSLIERLILFTLPLILISIIWGADIILEKSKSNAKWRYFGTVGIITISFLVAFSQTQGLIHLINPFEIEDNRSSLIYISNNNVNNAPIVCTHLAFPAYEYYSKYDCNYNQLQLGNAVGAKYNDNIIDLVQRKLTTINQNVWILMGHMSEEEISTLIKEFENSGTLKNSYRTRKSAAILFSTQ